MTERYVVFSIRAKLDVLNVIIMIIESLRSFMMHVWISVSKEMYGD